MKLKAEIKGITVGTLQGDINIEEAENDDEIMKRLDHSDDDNDNNNKEGGSETYGVNKLNKIFNKINKN
jgi:hypothetical protein